MVSRTWRVILTSVVIACFSTISFAASQKVLYSFTARRGDGAVPLAGVVFDSAGNLYGTTTGGGSDGDGIAFELSPMPDGEWAKTVLYNFNWTDGAHPEANLIFDSSGNLYGTTVYGGANGQGTVFELSPAEGGGWTEQVLHSFGEAFDGVQPHAPLIFDSSGNLYGTTAGHRGDYGSAFELSPAIDGSWTETTLCDFPVTLGGKENGWHPYGGLVFDAAGNLYGTTAGGGGHGDGSVFELTPSPDGTWTETLLVHASFIHGGGPYDGLILDAAGNLYGTNSYGGAHNAGTVFRLSPVEGGGWTPETLFDFSGANGQDPHASLIIGPGGHFYGTTEEGGANDTGTVFELTQNPKGEWVEGYFSLSGDPAGSLIFDAEGNAYGTTIFGGTYGAGSVFEIIP
jgi:uncharacterized repeat protein (TIGR03803 family)